MSKAFVKEDGPGEDEDEREEDAAVPGGKNYITPAGAGRLREEKRKLLDVERPTVVRAVTAAAANGDRSENADYIYGKRRLREIDRRIRFLSKRLEIAEIVDPLAVRSERALFGATVTVEDGEGKNRVYRIVGVDETDAAQGKISWLSPIGKALLQAKAGDMVTVRTPKGEDEWEVVSIRYETID